MTGGQPSRSGGSKNMSSHYARNTSGENMRVSNANQQSSIGQNNSFSKGVPSLQVSEQVNSVSDASGNRKQQLAEMKHIL